MVKSFILFMAVLFAGCAMPSSNTKDSLHKTSQKISVANWNVQTFFDSTTEGCEYDEFVKSKTWGQESYTERLKRLCQVIKSLDADVFVMEEIENEEVLHDLSNFLAGEWNQKKIYSQVVKDYPKFVNNDIDDIYTYTDTSGKIYITSKSSLSEAYSGKADLVQYTVNKNVPAYVGNSSVLPFDSTDKDLVSALEQIKKDFPADDIADTNNIYMWTTQGQTYFATYIS